MPLVLLLGYPSTQKPLKVPLKREQAKLWVTMAILSLFGFVGREATSGGHRCRCFGEGGSWAFVFPFSDTKDTTSPENVSPESSEITQEQLLDNFHLMTESSEDLPILWNAISNYESLKALEISDVKKWKVRPLKQVEPLA